MAGKAKKAPETVDFYRELGRAIRLARITAGKTQSETADHIDVSFQQLQKYENGANRIPVEQLVGLAAYLEVTLDELLALPEVDSEWQSIAERFRGDGFASLLESWAAIKDDGMRAAILNLIRRAGALRR